MPPLATDLTKSKPQSKLPLQRPQLTAKNGLALPERIQDLVLEDVETSLVPLLNATAIHITEYDLCDNPLSYQVHDALGSLVNPYTSHQGHSNSGCKGQLAMAQSRAMNPAVPLAPSLNSDTASSTFTNMKKMSQDSKDLSENVEEREAENLAYIQNTFENEQDVDVAYVGSWMQYNPSTRLKRILERDTVDQSDYTMQRSRLEHAEKQ
jgi:hypothetical protein